ncbi:MAG: hypothetical protein COB93_00460 [Sneathiella sp.]|nr:MAG: hypothetical protein COB93_00460 [Sneathiella sp.]
MNRFGAGEELLHPVKAVNRADFGAPELKVLLACADVVETEHHYNPLDAFMYGDQPVQFLLAEDSEEVTTLLREHEDIAVLMLDVSGKKNECGLQLLRHVRQDLGNRNIRVILVGAYSGYQQDWNVLRQYDVSDYRDISELTVPQLFTSLTIALQAYERLCTDENNKRALQTILDVTKELYGVRSVEEFCLTILTQLQVIHAPTEHCFFCIPDDKSGELVLSAGMGKYEGLRKQKVETAVNADMHARILEITDARVNRYEEALSILSIVRDGTLKGAVILETTPAFTLLEKRQIELICANITLGLENADMFEEIKRLAFHDSLTGLNNRAKFRNDVQSYLEGQEKGTFVVVQFVLDYLPELNIALGHESVDELLQFVSEQLSVLFPDAISLARTSGDGFGLCIPYGEIRDLRQIPRTIHSLFERSQEESANLPHVIPRIGLAIYPEDAGNAAALWRNTNIALATIRGKGSTYFRFYNKEIANDINARVEMNNALRQGIGREDLTLNYQPQIDLETGNVVGVEALVRWQRDGGHFVAPDEFIPIAETSGLIAPISEWVLMEACQKRREWLDQGATDFKVAINLSLSMFQNDDFAELMRHTLRKTACPPELVELEITESVIMEDPDQALRNFLELGEMGISFSIDDFGTGYSSLSYLRRLPVSVLKIDKAFVSGMMINADDAAITRTVIELGRNLGLTVLAEGVETKEQVAFLRAAKCHQAQGYIFSRPVQAHAVMSLLETTDFMSLAR